MEAWLESTPESPISRNTTDDSVLDVVFDDKAIYPQTYHDAQLALVPDQFLPKVGRHQVTGWEKVHSAIPEDDIFAAGRVDRVCSLVIVRPEMLVAHVLTLGTCDDSTEFSAKNMLQQNVRMTTRS